MPLEFHVHQQDCRIVIVNRNGSEADTHARSGHLIQERHYINCEFRRPVRYNFHCLAWDIKIDIVVAEKRGVFRLRLSRIRSGNFRRIARGNRIDAIAAGTPYRHEKAKRHRGEKNCPSIHTFASLSRFFLYSRRSESISIPSKAATSILYHFSSV